MAFNGKEFKDAMNADNWRERYDEWLEKIEAYLKTSEATENTPAEGISKLLKKFKLRIDRKTKEDITMPYEEDFVKRIFEAYKTAGKQNELIGYVNDNEQNIIASTVSRGIVEALQTYQLVFGDLSEQLGKVIFMTTTSKVGYFVQSPVQCVIKHGFHEMLNYIIDILYPTEEIPDEELRLFIEIAINRIEEGAKKNFSEQKESKQFFTPIEELGKFGHKDTFLIVHWLYGKFIKTSYFKELPREEQKKISDEYNNNCVRATRFGFAYNHFDIVKALFEEGYGHWSIIGWNNLPDKRTPFQMIKGERVNTNKADFYIKKLGSYDYQRLKPFYIGGAKKN